MLENEGSCNVRFGDILFIYPLFPAKQVVTPCSVFHGIDVAVIGDDCPLPRVQTEQVLIPFEDVQHHVTNKHMTK